jgi:hydroxysqualene dehydroxylase
VAASRTVAVVGAGWAGIAAAIEAAGRGWHVTLFDMAPEAGGRARRIGGRAAAGDFDNGQHILIGAYVETLALMRRVGIDPDAVLLRMPLTIAYPDDDGLVLSAGHAVPAFIGAVLRQHRWRLRERLALLRAALGWRLSGFRCSEALSVAELAASLPVRLREILIEPLCLSALNTPSSQASAQVFLTVLRDALFAGPGAADLLLPRRRLSDLLPVPALQHLAAAGADVRLGTRVGSVVAHPSGSGWDIDGERHDAVVLATSASEAARLAAATNVSWSKLAVALEHEPIITLNLESPGTRLARPMLALRSDSSRRPVQFVFDQGQLDGPSGVLSAVISAASGWMAMPADALVTTAIAQLRDQLGEQLRSEPRLLRQLTDKRATFRCTPGLRRPPAEISGGLLAAGDYVEGPYPATLEAAVRSGLAAARAL